MKKNGIKRIRFLAVVMALTSSLLLFSVGFSTWYNCKINVESGSGDITTYGVLHVRVDEFDIFRFSAIAFKDADNNDSNTGQIVVKYKISKETIETRGGTFDVETTLEYDGLSSYASGKVLFACLADPNDTKNTVAVTSDKGTISNTTVTEEAIGATVSFSSLPATADYEFSITYTFTVPYADGNFRNNFGRYIMVGNDSNITTTKFVATAQVSANE